MARNLVARSSDSTGEIVLLDEEGCPVDPLIFPNLKPLDKGSRGLQGAFQAFKFSDDSVVRFQVNVQFCLQECKPVSLFSNENTKFFMTPSLDFDYYKSFEFMLLRYMKLKILMKREALKN